MASKVFGDWGRLKNLAKNLPKDLKQAMEEVNENKANEIQAHMKGIIYNQTEAWPPIKEDTKNRKGSSKALIETGTLVESISVQGSGDEIVVAPTGSNPSGLSNQELGSIHEYGTEVVPPRPFVSPTYEQFQEEMPSIYSKTAKEVIKKY